MVSKIIALSEKFFQQTVQLRRQIHKNPELGFEEYETAELIATTLKNLGWQVREGVAKTGVVGLLKGTKPGPTIALRADMDALPIDEQTDLSFASEHPGKMHACGHDAHVAILLGTALVLTELRQELKGSVKLIFQPAEEGPGGAIPMIEAG
ncbi:MAG: amidohydrolase, partial [Firmicutes bacterium]|nr:amidohydrolase [Bacillota bacterium]